MEDFVFQRDIGSGSIGKVKLAKNMRTGEDVAVKVIQKAVFANSAVLKNRIQREIALMRIFDHPNILSLYNVIESDRNIYLIEKYAAHGSVFDVIQTLSLESVLNLFRQIIYGLEYLHQHGVCHRDIKPENLLLDAADQLMIADFGFARWMPMNIANTTCGSPHYTAPEVMSGKQYDGRAADKKLPFYDESVRVTMSLIKKGKYDMPEDLPFCVKDLLSRLLVVDPAQRITIHDIKRHPAVRIGLPENYILPSPLPLESLAEPIALSLSDESLLPALVQIGFSDVSELVNQLSSNTPNMAKVFYRMLSQPFDPQKVEWGKSAEPAEWFEDEHPFLAPMDYQAVSSDPCDSPVIGRSMSPCEPCEWLPQMQAVAIFQQEQEIPNINISVPEAMTIIQHSFGGAGYLWYHPNDRTMLLKDPRAEIFVSLIANLDSQQLITLVVKMCNGSNEQFQSFFEQVDVLFGGYIKTVDVEQLTEANAMRSSNSSEYGPSVEEERCHPM